MRLISSTDATLAVQDSRTAYHYRHVVSFEETNVMGNVYFAHYITWQGRCREQFLRDHAPDVLARIGQGLRLVTLRTSCEYFDELFAFDEVEIRMRLAFMRGNRVGLGFEYYAIGKGGERRAAYGTQEIGCMKLIDHRLAVAPWPASLETALTRYR